MEINRGDQLNKIMTEHEELGSSGVSKFMDSWEIINFTKKSILAGKKSEGLMLMIS